MSMTDPSTPPVETDAMREAREAAERASQREREALARARELETEMAFRDVGLTPDQLDSELGQMFREVIGRDEEAFGDDGPNLDRIRARAGAIGLLNAEPTPPPPPPAAESTGVVDQGQARTDLGAGAAPVATPHVVDEHPGEKGLEEFFKARAGGASSEDAAAEYLDRVIDAGVKGDDRVIFGGRRS